MLQLHCDGIRWSGLDTRTPGDLFLNGEKKGDMTMKTKLLFLSTFVVFSLAFGQVYAQTTPSTSGTNQGNTGSTLNPVFDTTNSATQTFDSTAPSGEDCLQQPGRAEHRRQNSIIGIFQKVIKAKIGDWLSIN